LRLILMLDNYDSFVYNLVQYLKEMGHEVAVYRNDSIDVSAIERMSPNHIIISPGPCTPDEAGVSLEAVSHLAGKIPILGVCLGHQSIGQAFGGRVVRAGRPMHGKTSAIRHDGRGIFRGLPQDLVVGRYHSLVVSPQGLPDCLEVTSLTGSGEIMGIRHREYYVEGVQFHPESILTSHGKEMLKNFLHPREVCQSELISARKTGYKAGYNSSFHPFKGPSRQPFAGQRDDGGGNDQVFLYDGRPLSGADIPGQ